MRKREVLKAGWISSGSSLGNMKQLETMPLKPRNNAMLGDMLPDLNSSVGTSIFQRKRSTSHHCCCCCCCCSCCCC